MTMGSLDIVFYTAIFILPGFVICSIIELTNPPPKYYESKYFLRCFMFSIINCALLSWAYYFIITCSIKSTSMRLLLLVLASILGSIIVGIIIAIIIQRQLIDKFLSKIGIKTIHTTPTAWDYIFSKQKPSFIIITLIDNSVVYGWYSTNSFTSSDPDDHDIYVESCYKNDWSHDEEDNGFYIPKDQIKLIEFRSVDKQKKGEQNG